MVRTVKLVKSSSASPKVSNCSGDSSRIFWLTVEDISPKRRLSSCRIKATASYCLPFFRMSWSMTDSPIISSLNKFMVISLLNTNPARIAVATAKLLFSVLPLILSRWVELNIRWTWVELKHETQRQHGLRSALTHPTNNCASLLINFCGYFGQDFPIVLSIFL